MGMENDLEIVALQALMRQVEAEDDWASVALSLQNIMSGVAFGLVVTHNLTEQQAKAMLLQAADNAADVLVQTLAKYRADQN